MPITTTLNRIRAHRPCSDGWAKLLAGLGKTEADDETLPYTRIVEINGIDDALWACCAEPQYSREWRLYAVWCARQVEYLMTDERSKSALVVAELYANGQATDDELAAAGAAAEAAGAAAGAAARAVARDAARAAAWAAAWAAARDAAWDAAWAAAGAAAWAAARDAAWAAARAVARAVARDAQTAHFIKICNETEAR